jgi:hypothetical protein
LCLFRTVEDHGSDEGSDDTNRDTDEHIQDISFLAHEDRDAPKVRAAERIAEDLGDADPDSARQIADHRSCERSLVFEVDAIKGWLGDATDECHEGAGRSLCLEIVVLRLDSDSKRHDAMHRSISEKHQIRRNIHDDRYEL